MTSMPEHTLETMLIGLSRVKDSGEVVGIGSSRLDNDATDLWRLMDGRLLRELCDSHLETLMDFTAEIWEQREYLITNKPEDTAILLERIAEVCSAAAVAVRRLPRSH
jgi:hypothetical protein